ncbi:MAG TPA: thioredoxin family protein [Thermoanaerobaculia bacterium]|nr:thioredoxin family protein [Thermoanaerobaculia bacterium]
MAVMKTWNLPVLLSTLAVVAALVSGAHPVRAAEESSVPVGPVTREQVEAAAPQWVQIQVEAKIDSEVARALASVEPGAEVTVFLGTWCGDSGREVPRFWRALDEAGAALPFQVRYIAVDAEKKQPGEAVTGNDIRYVPTFIVRREGREVGRIVEESPNGIEKDLLALLTGREKGLITTREDLQTASPSKPSR